MAQPQGQKKSKAWIWILVIVLVVACCLVVVGAAVFIYFRSDNPSSIIDSIFPPKESSVTPPEEGLAPIQEEDWATTPELETTLSQPELSEALLLTTDVGIWAIDEATKAATQLSSDPMTLDNVHSLAPDQKHFAYLTGFGGASYNPILTVLSVENQTILLQIELTGPMTQPNTESSVGDPAFEAIRAMNFTDSLAWSPDGTRLAFVAARDGNSADIYLLNLVDNAVTRLTYEAGHASGLHWSPDARFLQYMSVTSFGTGAGLGMEGLWVYDTHSNQPLLLETLDSNGEEFIAWMDNSRFLITSWGQTCGGNYNLRIVDAISLEQRILVDSGFTAVAYDPENQFGIFSVAYTYDNCGNVALLDQGLYIFGESVPVLGPDGPIAGEIGRKKFEQVTAYSIGFIPQGNLFTVYGDEGLQQIYYKGEYGWVSLDSLPEVKGLKPYPGPEGSYWAWASYYSGKPGLWITQNSSNPIQLSSLYTGTPVWNQDGDTLYYIENSQLFKAQAPQFIPELMVEFQGIALFTLIK